MKRFLKRVVIWFRRQNAKFLPLSMSDADFRRYHANAPKAEPSRELWWDGEQWH